MIKHLKTWARSAAAGLVAVLGGVEMMAFDPITDDSGIYVVVWERGTVDVVNNLPHAATLSDGTTFRGSMDAALTRWNGVLGNVQFAVSHGTTGDYGVGNTVNEFALDASIGDFDFGDATLAVTLSFSDGGNTRVESDVIFNDRWEWDSYRGDLRSAEDVRRVSIHELGHVLGLDHPDEATPSQQVDAVMNSIVSDTDDLRQDDIDGGQWLYGAPDSLPANDNFADAIELVLNENGEASVTRSSVQSTAETGEPVLDTDYPGGRSVWWSWTASANRLMQVTTLGSRFDTIMGVFTGSDVANLTTIEVNDDVEPGVIRTSTITFVAVSGTTYHFMVDGWAGYEGAVVLNLRELESPGPLVEMAEQRFIAPLGEDLTFTVTAHPVLGGSLSYRWRKNNQLIPGETGTSLTLQDVTNDDVGAYTVEVTEAGDESTYASAFVLPNYPGTRISQWGDITPDTSDAELIPTDLTDVIALAGGGRHGLALRADGTVVGWGGQNSSANYDVGPEIPPLGLDEVVAIAAGNRHSLALRADGTVVAWGGHTINSRAQVPEGLNAIAIAAEDRYCFALLVDGSLAVWDVASESVYADTLPQDVVAFGSHSTLHVDGSVRTWDQKFEHEYAAPPRLAQADLVAGSYDVVVGRTPSGETRVVSTVTGGGMLAPEGVDNVVALTVDDGAVFAIKADGSVIAWGEVSSGQNFAESMPDDLANVVQVEIGEIAMALHVDPATEAPVVLDFPADLTVTEDEAVVLSARVGGHNPFTFEWLLDGVPLSADDRVSGAGSARLLIDPVKPEDAGTYTLRVSNAAGTVTSAAAELSVRAVGQFTQYPLTQLAGEGGEVEFSTQFEGTGSITYQWYFNEDAIAGADEATLRVTDLTLADAGRYAVRASDDVGSKWAQANLIVSPTNGGVETVDGNWSGIPFPAPAVPATTQSAAKLAIDDHGLVLLANGELLNLSLAGGVNTALPVDPPTAVDIAVGTEFSVVLLPDGTVQAWGDNDAGQTDVPETLADVIAVEAGYGYAVALQSDGSVVAWGEVEAFERIIGDLKDVVAMAVSGSRGYALHRDGSVSAWGTAEQLPTHLDDVVKLISYGGVTLALLDDGTVEVWGDTLNFPTIEFSNDERVQDVDFGLTGGVAFGDQGSTLQWNYQDTIIDELPDDLANLVSVAVGNFMGFITRVDVPAIQSLPEDVSVEGDEDLVFSVGWSGSSVGVITWFRDGQLIELNERITMDADGTLRISGAVLADSGNYTVEIANAAGAVTSDPFTVEVRGRPTLVRAMTNRHVAAGTSLVLDATAVESGVSYRWFRGGEALSGETGPTLEFDSIQIADTGYYTVEMTAPGGGQREVTVFVSVVGSDQTVTMWGGDTAGLDTPPNGITDIVQISSRSGHTLALTGSGAVLAWGLDADGRIDVPSGVGRVVEVSGGQGVSLVLSEDGKVHMWGDVRASRMPPENLPAITSISAGQEAGAALSIDGEVFAWGLYYDFGGEPLDIPPAIAIHMGPNAYLSVLLADGSVRLFREGRDITDEAFPDGLSDVVRISSSALGSFAVTATGEVVFWGSADGTPPADLADVVMVSGGNEHQLALREDGTVVAWGNGYLGQTLVPEGLANVTAVEASSSASFALVPMSAGELAITEHPQGITPLAGEPFSLAVGARAGAGNLTYQWFVDGAALVDGGDVSGAQTAELSIAFASELHDGEYTVQVSDDAQMVTTLPVSVVTEVSGEAPTFVARPLSQRARQGSTVTFTAEIEGAVRYQWWRNRSPLTSETAPSLHLSEVQLEDHGFFELRAVGPGGRIATTVVHLNVMPAQTELVAFTPGQDDADLMPPEDVGEAGAIYAGFRHGFVLRPDGSMRAWGTSTSGAIAAANQLSDVVGFDVYHSDFVAVHGDGTVTTSNASWNEELVSRGIDDAVAVASGSGFALVLLADGTVDHVGYVDDFPESLDRVVDIAAGNTAAMALLEDGSMVFWGAGTLLSAFPTDVTGLVDIGMSLRAGVGQFRDGTIAVWGSPDEIPAVPADLGPVQDVNCGIYEIGIIDARGTAAFYAVEGPTFPVEGWINMRRLAVSSSVMLGLRSTVYPRIEIAPVDQEVAAGGDAVFAVTVSGEGELHYQWLRNGVELVDGGAVTGAQSAELTIAGAGSEDIGEYQVVVIDAHGTAFSETVELVLTTPVITAQPEHQATSSGGHVVMSVGVSAPGDVTYQWYRGASGETGVPIAGATDDHVTFTGADVAGQVWVRVSNEHGFVDSASAHMLAFRVHETPVAPTPLHSVSHVNGHYWMLGPVESVTTNDLQTWQVGPEIGSIHADVVFGHGVYVRGGGHTTETIYVSEDGSTWENVVGYASGSTVDDVAFNGSRFVAVSWVSGYSDDGRNWTTGEAFSASSVVWGEDRFVAVGSEPIRVSTDGATWQAAPMVPGRGLSEVIHGGGRFVAAGHTGGVGGVWYSDDGYTWVQAAAPEGGFPGVTMRLAWGNGVYVMVPVASSSGASAADIFISTDGARWSRSNAGYTQSTDVVFANGQFVITDYEGRIHASDPLPNSVSIDDLSGSAVVLGGEPTRLEVVVSGDAATYQWYRGPSGSTADPIAGATGATLDLTITEDTEVWVRVTNAVSSVDSATIALTVAQAPEFVTLPQSIEAVAGEEATLSLDVTALPAATLQWYEGESGDTSQPVTGANASELSLIVPDDITSYWVRASNMAGVIDSPAVEVTPWHELRNWGDLRALAPGGPGLVGLAYDGILQSATGDTWERLTPADFPDLKAIAWEGTLAVGVGDAGTTLHRSADLRNWTTTPVSVGETISQLFGVTRAFGYFWVGTSIPGKVLRSATGDVWELISLGPDAADVTVHAWWIDADGLVAVGGSTSARSVAVLRSADGVAWSHTALNVPYATGDSRVYLTAVQRLDDGRYYAWERSYQAVFMSLDGESWQLLDRDATGLSGVTGFGRLGRQTVATTTSGIHVSDDGVAWEPLSYPLPRGLETHGLLALPGRLLVEGGGFIWETPNLQDWVVRAGHPKRSNTVYDAVVGEGVYVSSVFGEGDAFSRDGRTWRPTADALGRQSGGRFGFGAGRFLVSDPDTAGAYWWSDDGERWTTATIAEWEGGVTEFAYVNGEWFALGPDGQFARSTHGLDWTIDQIAGATGTTYDITHGGGTYAMTVDRNVWTSTDLSNWVLAETLDVFGLSLAHDQGRFVVAGSANRSQIYSSTNGADWTLRYDHAQNGLSAVVSDGERFFATSPEGLLVSEDGMNWRTTAVPGGYRLSSNSGRTISAGFDFYVRAAAAASPPQFNGALRVGVPTPNTDFSIVADVVGEFESLRWLLDGEPLSDGETYAGTSTQTLVVSGASAELMGEYELVVTYGDGSALSQSVPVALVEVPRIVSGPEAVSLVVGEDLELSVIAEGLNLSYAWFRDGSPLAGAEAAILTINEVTLADAGRYQVEVSNEAGKVGSASVFVSVLPPGVVVTGTHASQPSHYLPGGEVVVENAIAWSGDLDGLTLSVVLPDGWALVEADGAGASVTPQAGDTALLEWIWTTLPDGPITLNYTLAVPLTDREPLEIWGLVEVEVSGETAMTLLAPDPLPMLPALHSADTDRDQRIGLAELLRVIELYNTRAGTSRTGRYAEAVDSVDGFTPDARALGEGELPARIHSGDTDANGMFSLPELLRVIELYNTRTGTSRTGAYRLNPDSVDGFAPDP